MAAFKKQDFNTVLDVVFLYFSQKTGALETSPLLYTCMRRFYAAWKSNLIFVLLFIF